MVEVGIQKEIKNAVNANMYDSVFELTDGRFLYCREWNGESWSGFWCDRNGYALNPEEDSFKVTPIHDPDEVDDETGEVLQWRLAALKIDY